MEGEEYKLTLTELFSSLASNASKLAAHGSSQVNESQNNVMASRAPKARHYGDSESLSYRVAGAACQTNEGDSYVADVCRLAGLSPGAHCQNAASRLDSAREKSKVLKASIHFQRQRLFLSSSRSSQTASDKFREGLT